MVLPAGDGQATITATLQGRRATAPLTVSDFSFATTWSFRNDVLPVMTKVGCNSGPCHGAAAGKNGFKLTLRGFDPIADYYTLTRQALARRTDRLEPAKSLILLKPTLTIPHGGGKRFQVASSEYKIISGWVAQGMPAPRESDPLVTDIQVLPHEASLIPGAEQQLIVTAVFSDGHTADVTRWAKYDSGDEGVATVDNNGHVTMHGYGEAPVTVWYQSHVAFSRLRIPFPIPPFSGGVPERRRATITLTMPFWTTACAPHSSLTPGWGRRIYSQSLSRCDRNSPRSIGG